MNNAKAYDIALRKCSEMFIYGKELGFNFTILDIGGGFKGYSKHLSELNDSAEVINASLKSYFKEFTDLKLIAEPGSFFSTSPPIICLKVLGKVKEEGNGKPVSLFIAFIISIYVGYILLSILKLILISFAVLYKYWYSIT